MPMTPVSKQSEGAAVPGNAAAVPGERCGVAAVGLASSVSAAAGDRAVVASGGLSWRQRVTKLPGDGAESGRCRPGGDGVLTMLHPLMGRTAVF